MSFMCGPPNTSFLSLKAPQITPYFSLNNSLPLTPINPNASPSLSLSNPKPQKERKRKSKSFPSPMYATLSSPLGARPINNFAPISRRRKAATVRNSVQTASFRSSTSTDNKSAAMAVAVAGSLYEVLRVERSASVNEIKTAYRSLAKVYHPDAMGSSSDGRDFIKIQSAYATLSDPTARAMYDMSLGARARRVRPRVYPTRRWETDQCW